MQTRECLVSVLCTAYNHEKYIRQTLQSFVDQQTDFAFEVLVNDDKSTDGTAAIIREFEEKYPDIIRAFYQEENLYSQGVYINREVFLPNARGKYIAYCEGDDYWTDPLKLQLQADFLESHPEYSACVHNTMLHYCAGDQPDKLLLRNRKGDCDVRIEDVAKGVSYSFHTSSILVKKELLDNPPAFSDESYTCGFDDHPEALWFMFNGPVRYLDRCMSVYRINSGTSSWSIGVDHEYAKLRDYAAAEISMLRACLRESPEEFKPAIEHEILAHEFDLMYIEGRDREQRKPPYDAILRTMPRSYRVNNFIKCTFPGLHKLYRRFRGYKG